MWIIKMNIFRIGSKATGKKYSFVKKCLLYPVYIKTNRTYNLAYLVYESL